MPASTIATSSGADDLSMTVELGLPPSRNMTTKLQFKICTPLHHIDNLVLAGSSYRTDECSLGLLYRPLNLKSKHLQGFEKNMRLLVMIFAPLFL